MSESTLPMKDTLNFDVRHYLLYLLLSLGGWLTLYGLLRFYFHNQTAEWCVRIVSFIHGCIMGLLGIQQCLGTPYPFSDKNIESTNYQKVILIVSGGYFIHDLIWCLINRTESQLMLFHHVFSIAALLRTSWRNTSAAQACCGLGGAEVTNPLLQIRWFIRYAGYKDTKLFIITECTFCMLFFIVRIVVGTMIMASLHADWEIWLMCLSIYMISWLFMFNIIVYFEKKFFRHEPLGTTYTQMVQIES